MVFLVELGVEHRMDLRGGRAEPLSSSHEEPHGAQAVLGVNGGDHSASDVSERDLYGSNSGRTERGAAGNFSGQL